MSKRPKTRKPLIRIRPRRERKCKVGRATGSTPGRGPLAADNSASEDHVSSSENEEGTVSGLGSALNTFRTFGETSDATALVENLTSTNNGLLSASEDQFEHDDGYAAAEAETSRGIRHRAATKVGKKRVSTKSRIKGKQVWKVFYAWFIFVWN